MDIQGVTSYDETAAKRVYGNKELGREDFLNLLMKELSCQDPLEPMDSKEFIGQITQFTSLEELTTMNDTLAKILESSGDTGELVNIKSTLDDVLASQRSMQNMAITGMIGRNVMVEGNSVYLTDSAEISYDLANNASSVTVTITDWAGDKVRVEELGISEAGRYTYSWDGKDTEGNSLPEGSYKVSIEAKDFRRNPFVVNTMMTGEITGVNYDKDNALLVLDGARRIRLEDIKSIVEQD
ncbi:MAG: hypothetical protein OEU95_01495 [Nitrospirota bacterium]|nr:hypothetical protein [Nitrospirota bacterium]